MLSIDVVYQLCNRYQWFTYGTVEQYDRMFNMVRERKSIHDIATVIWICSAPNFTVQDIEKTLKAAAR